MKNSGFSLLELLLALGILGIIAVFAVSISQSSKNLAKANDTKKRMLRIQRAAIAYYQAHRDLPAPIGNNEVPVAAAAFNLEQQHRLDAWGRYFHYDRALHPVYSSRTAITGITVDGKPVAGVIVSGGPNQAVDAANKQSPYSTKGDDLVLAISVHEQAYDNAMEDLKVLQSKAQALDNIFAGVDNNSNGRVDENGCVQAIGCPHSGTANDPNCGTAILDAVSSSYIFCGHTVNTASELLARFYELNETILLDPWLHRYVWGGSSICSRSDLCYHRFFSAGPDDIAGNADDILP